ncbi:hypothetical protein [Natrinema gari]|uniref:Uncharacterized protein n=1 Tax=Natrinema gari JCM 14663 TaxID=1230459 RepID=L9YR19_9EURY|nr:hypothetical protein [Natrinema gari]ELY76670.1 hypothetical protein C486_17597 [Natrinema gari JCM 14663]
MPRYTETYDLSEEKERLDSELDELADRTSEIEQQMDDLDDDEELTQGQLHEYRESVQEGNRLEQMYAGVQWALDPDGDREPIKEVTLGSLTAGEYAEVGDRLQAVKQGKVGWGRNPDLDNARRNMFAGACLQDAPFLDEEDPDLEAKIHAVTDLAPAFIHWLEERGDELTTPQVEGNGFRKRVEERRTTSTPKSPT